MSTYQQITTKSTHMRHVSPFLHADDGPATGARTVTGLGVFDIADPPGPGPGDGVLAPGSSTTGSNALYLRPSAHRPRMLSGAGSGTIRPSSHIPAGSVQHLLRASYLSPPSTECAYC